MKTQRILSVLTATAFFAGPLAAQQPQKTSTSELNTLLQKGLIEEEGNQNLEAASAAYRELAEAFENERRLAATAIYRLAEIARKQNRRDEAVKLYQRIATEFATCEPMARMSRENLVTLGSNVPNAAAAPAPITPGTTDEVAELRSIMKQSPDLINSPDQEGLCPIHRAARDGRRETVVFLLDNKVPVDTLSRTGRTALHFAAEAGHKAVAELLVEKGAKVDALLSETVPAKSEPLPAVNGTPQWRIVEYGRRVTDATPLHLALLSRRAALAEWLISKGAGVNAPLKMASITGSGDLINDNAKRGLQTPLSLAATAGLFEIVDLLLAKGADPAVEIVDEFGNSSGTLLHMAVRKKNLTLIDKLLAHGMSIDIPDKDQRPPLYEARNMATLRHLLDKGAKVPPNALFNIVLPGPATREAWELLMSRGADVKALNKNGESLLTSGYLSTNDAALVNWLLDQGVAAETGERSAFTVHSDAAARAIYDRVILPKLFKEPAVTVSFVHERAQWEALRRGRDDEPPPSLAEVMQKWIRANMQMSSTGNNPLLWRFQQKPGAGTVYPAGGNPPAIDWSALTIVRPGNDGKPVRETIKLDPGKTGEAPPQLPWGAVIELTWKANEEMGKSVSNLFDEWHRTRATVTVGDVRKEITVPVRTGWPQANTVQEFVTAFISANPRARTTSMVLQRKTAAGPVSIDLPEAEPWPRVVDGDEVIVKERPLTSPATLERLRGKNLIFLPDQNQWLLAGSKLLASLKNYSPLLAGRDLSTVKVVMTSELEKDPDMLQHPEKMTTTDDLEKVAAEWDEEATVYDIDIPASAGSGRMIILPPAAEGKTGMSDKLRRMIGRAFQPPPAFQSPPPTVTRPGQSVPAAQPYVPLAPGRSDSRRR